MVRTWNRAANDTLDWKGLAAVTSGRAARQIQTSPNREERFHQRAEAIRAAQTLGLRYKVTPFSVLVGDPKHYAQPTVSIPPVVEDIPKPKAIHKRTVLYSRRSCDPVPRVRRTSRADIE